MKKLLLGLGSLAAIAAPVAAVVACSSNEQAVTYAPVHVTSFDYKTKAAHAKADPTYNYKFNFDTGKLLYKVTGTGKLSLITKKDGSGALLVPTKYLKTEKTTTIDPADPTYQTVKTHVVVAAGTPAEFTTKTGYAVGDVVTTGVVAGSKFLLTQDQLKLVSAEKEYVPGTLYTEATFATYVKGAIKAQDVINGDDGKPLPTQPTPEATFIDSAIQKAFASI